MSCLADVGQGCEEGAQLQAGRVNLVLVYGLTSYTEHLNLHRPETEFTSLFGRSQFYLQFLFRDKKLQKKLRDFASETVNFIAADSILVSRLVLYHNSFALQCIVKSTFQRNLQILQRDSSIEFRGVWKSRGCWLPLHDEPCACIRHVISRSRS